MEITLPDPETEPDTGSPTPEEIPQPPLLVGDFVQVRRALLDEPVEVAEGILAEITEDHAVMGTREYLFADGWAVELISRVLVFPETLSEILAWLYIEPAPVALMGRGQTWARSDDGQAVPVESIKAFVQVPA